MLTSIVFIVISLTACSYSTPVAKSSDNVAMEMVVPRGFTREEYIQSIVDYWTPERMASAIPLDVLTVDEHELSRLGNTPKEQKAATILTQSDLHSGMTLTKPKVAGKVFFTSGGSNYICSGSVVNSPKGDTVVTAGHCVYNYERQEWASRWIFVPGYSFPSRPYGSFTFRVLTTKAGWMNSRDFNNDVGVVRMNTNENGQQVQEVAGGLGITLDGDRDEYIYAFGYPKNINNGDTVSYCANTPLSPSFITGFFGLQLSCGMTGGASGGPWAQSYDVGKPSGQQVSLVSFGITGLPDNIFGPYFTDSNIGSLYRESQEL